MVEHPVDQPGTGPDPRRVALPPVPVHVRNGAEPAQPAQPVLHHDPGATAVPANQTAVPSKSINATNAMTTGRKRKRL